MKVNVSLLKRWMGCPLQARFEEIENRPRIQNAKASFGTCIHDALELFNHTGDLDRALQRFFTTWANPELLNVTPDTWPRNTTYGSLRQKGEEILRGYADKLRWEKREVIATEHKFHVPFGEHSLSGVVDLLEVKKSSRGKETLRVIDYKTNAKKPTINTLKLDIQFTAYVYASLQPEFWVGSGESKYPGLPDGEALYERFLDTPRKAIWFQLWDNKEVSVGDRDDDDFMRLYRCVVEVANAIEKDVYIPNISGDTCVWCDFTDICKAVIPVRKKLESSDQEQFIF